MKANKSIKPCPFCGMEADEDCGDTLHPSGTGWKYRPDLRTRSYHDLREVPEEQWCYSLNCVLHHGGCGAEMTGDSREEVIAKWNKRVTPKE